MQVHFVCSLSVRHNWYGAMQCLVSQSCTVRDTVQNSVVPERTPCRVPCRATDVHQPASYNVQLRRLCRTLVLRVSVPIHQCYTSPGVDVDLAVDSSTQACRLTVLRSDSSARVAPKWQNTAATLLIKQQSAACWVMQCHAAWRGMGGAAAVT